MRVTDGGGCDIRVTDGGGCDIRVTDGGGCDIRVTDGMVVLDLRSPSCPLLMRGVDPRDSCFATSHVLLC